MTIPRAVAVVISDGRALVIKRYLRHANAIDCVICEETPWQDSACPGHHYAVLPGGGVEEGESPEEAAVRELREETTLDARIERILWTGNHRGRPATYFLMGRVTGTPLLSGREAQAHNVDNSFELLWAGAGDLDRLRLFPAEIRQRLASLLL